MMDRVNSVQSKYAGKQRKRGRDDDGGPHPLGPRPVGDLGGPAAAAYERAQASKQVKTEEPPAGMSRTVTTDVMNIINNPRFSAELRSNIAGFGMSLQAATAPYQL
jgi:hypothetical protein